MAVLPEDAETAMGSVDEFVDELLAADVAVAGKLRSGIETALGGSSC
jgi:hypothetical protein